MTLAEAIVIGLGGFIGAVLRFVISSKFNNEEGIPMGTLAVNLAGSLLIGFLFGLQLPKLWTVFFVSGLLGALTTYSTLMKELLWLWECGKKKKAILYGLITFAAGIGLAYAGFVIGRLY